MGRAFLAARAGSVAVGPPPATAAPRKAGYIHMSIRYARLVPAFLAMKTAMKAYLSTGYASLARDIPVVAIPIWLAVLWFMILSAGVVYLMTYACSFRGCPCATRSGRSFSQSRSRMRPEAQRRLMSSEAAPDPPPICSPLVLPTNEAYLEISMEKLEKLVQRGSTQFDITGESGEALLRAVVTFEAGGKRSVSLFAAGTSTNDPQCTVFTVVEASGMPTSTCVQAMQVYGRESYLYGSFMATPDGTGHLRFDSPPLCGTEVASFEVGSWDSFEVSATTMSGYRLAAAARSGAQWRLQVAKNADAVLVCSCTLALLLLLRPQRPGSAATAAGAAGGPEAPVRHVSWAGGT